MKNHKNYGNRFIAMLLLVVMAMSSISLEVFANTETSDIKPIEPQTDYFHLDGKLISTDDEMVLNIVPVRKSNPLLRSASAPPITAIVALSSEFVPDATLSLEGNLVHANRYIAQTSDGIEYEVFFAATLCVRGLKHPGMAMMITEFWEKQLYGLTPLNTVLLQIPIFRILTFPKTSV